MSKINDLLDRLKASASTEAKEFEALKPVTKEAPSKGASYFEQKQFISRSDLLKIQKPDLKSYQPAFRMGSIIDSFLTEPEQFLIQYKDQVTEFEALQLVRLKHALKKAMVMPDQYWHYHDTLMSGLTAQRPKSVRVQAEYYRQKFDVFGDGSAFIPVRCKLDIQLGKKVIDLKSTTKTTYLEFSKDIKHHQLDMQAAFYSDTVKADSFTLVVLPYQNPNHVFKALKGSLKDTQQAVTTPDVWHHTFSDKELQKGRDKYRAIARKGIENGKIKTV